jgi:hypothetical protein
MGTSKLRCPQCGGVFLILNGLHATTFHERIRIGHPHGLVVERTRDTLPSIAFVLHCGECGRDTEVIVREARWSGGVEITARPGRHIVTKEAA